MTTVAVPIRERENYLNQEYGIKSWLLTTDHKRIALLYLLSITFFFFIGGFFALLIRLELLTPAGDLVQADTYNKLFTMHGQVMVFFFLIPAVPAVLGNFLIPIMIGAKDLAFPRVNLLSWYIFMLGSALMLYTILNGGVDTGWTFYTPLSTEFLTTNVVAAAMAIFVVGFSSILTGLNFIVTVHRLRAPGMTWSRLPLFVWANYATSIIFVLGTPVLAISLALVGLERIFHLGIFDPRLGGDPLLFQHLFWFYSHPAVYVMILPGMGVVSEIVACFSHKRLFGYKFMALALIAIAVLGFLVWAHHMFVAGISLYAAMIFSFFSYMVAVPSAIKVFNWTATLYKGSISYTTPMLYAFGFIGLFTMGGDDWTVRGRARDRCACDGHLFHHRAFPLHHGRRHGDGLPRGHAFLVAKDFRAHVSGRLGEAGSPAHLCRIQSHLLPPVHFGLHGHAEALLAVLA